MADGGLQKNNLKYNHIVMKNTLIDLFERSAARFSDNTFLRQFKQIMEITPDR